MASRNYDIFIKKRVDSGTTFGSPLNLSNSMDISEHPQLSTFGSEVYAALSDNTPGNRECYLKGARTIEPALDKHATTATTSLSHNQ